MFVSVSLLMSFYRYIHKVCFSLCLFPSVHLNRPPRLSACSLFELLLRLPASFPASGSLYNARVFLRGYLESVRILCWVEDDTCM